MRKKIVACNWKMNMDYSTGIALAEGIRDYFKNKVPVCEVIICSPFIHLASLQNILKGSIIKYGAQNCHQEESGAYTGEISAGMIKSTGAE